MAGSTWRFVSCHVMAGSTWRFVSCHVMAGSIWRFVSCHVMAGCNHRFISCHGVVRSTYRRFIMDMWYGRCCFSKYSITILILMILVHFKVILLLDGYTCLCLAYVVFSADYGFPNIVSAYL